LGSGDGRPEKGEWRWMTEKMGTPSGYFWHAPLLLYIYLCILK